MSGDWDADPYAEGRGWRPNGSGNGYTNGRDQTNGANSSHLNQQSNLDEIVTRATAIHEGRRFERQASGIWLSTEGHELKLDKATGTLTVLDKNSSIVPPLVEDDLDLHPVNFGSLRLKAEELKPRGWVLSTWLCRQFISSLIAAGAAGKTILRLLCALKIATGRFDILPHLHLFERVPVLFLCFEDGTEELYRQLKAAMRHYNISDADIEGYLWVEAITDARMKLVLEDEFRQHRVGPLKAALDRVVTQITGPQREKLGTVFLDPLIKTHSVGENDNTAMDMVMQILAGLAIDRDLAVDIPQHTSKRGT